MIFLWSCLSKPVITEITIMSTLIPRTTPRIEIKVMTERKVRFGFK